MTLASIVKKIPFFKINPINALGSKFDLDQGQLGVIISINIGRLNIPNATYQVPRSMNLLVLVKNILRGFKPYMSVEAILVMSPEQFV